ncbi:MAG: hypothetical protein U9R60_15790 [Bacteroidota bacterium]|nr:hypothetical protein [Bacteroidota bacterium]
MIRIIRVIMLFLFTAFLMQSCEYEWIVPDDPEMPDVISYSNNIQPIFDRSCNTSGCHSSGGPSPNLSTEVSYNELLGDGYVNVDDPESSTLYTSVRFGSMKAYAQPGDAAYILKWIEQGAQNN